MSGRAAYRRRIALLSILAAARGRPVGRERLVGLLWADFTTDAARHTLSQALYVVRRELGEDVFVTVGDEVGLNPECIRSDVDAFQTALEEGRTEDAVRAYGGPFLDGFFVPGALEFERWSESERDRLARAYGDALGTLAERCEAADQLREAIGWWRKLAAHDPFSSRTALRLAQALHRAGESAAALRHADTHAALLDAELGVAPDADLARFVEHVHAAAVPLPTPPPRAPSPSADYGAVHPVQPAGTPDDGGAEAAREHVESNAPTQGPRSVEGAPGRARRVPPGRKRWPARLALGAAVVVLATTLFVRASARRGEELSAVPARPDPHRIAVLYFEDHSPGADLSYLAGGLTESLIHELDQVDALTVISRSGVRPYRDGRVPLDSITARLKVGSVVEGTVQRAGDSVRVTVRLVDATSQAPLESRQIVRPLEDVLALETALGEEVGDFLRRRLGREARLRHVGAGTRNSAARTLVLRAADLAERGGTVGESRHALDVGSSLALTARADSLLALAEREDPAWLLPTTLRARFAVEAAARVRDGRRGPLLVVARDHAERVLRRAPGNAVAHFVRGDAARLEILAKGAERASPRELDRAEADLRAAVLADSALAPAWGSLAQLLVFRGRTREARDAAEHAIRADAYLESAPFVLRRVFFAALGQPDYAAAESVCARGGRLFPADFHFVECRLILLRENTSRAPDADLAWRLVARLEQMDPPARARADGRPEAPLIRPLMAAAVSARAGDTPRARAALSGVHLATREDSVLRVRIAYEEAHVHAFLGDREAARERLDLYLAARPEARDYLSRDPLLHDVWTPPVRPRPSGPPGS